MIFHDNGILLIPWEKKWHLFTERTGLPGIALGAYQDMERENGWN